MNVILEKNMEESSRNLIKEALVFEDLCGKLSKDLSMLGQSVHVWIDLSCKDNEELLCQASVFADWRGYVGASSVPDAFIFSGKFPEHYYVVFAYNEETFREKLAAIVGEMCKQALRFAYP